MNWEDILLREPVNRTASLVVNQCGCDSAEDLADLCEQRIAARRQLALMQKYKSGGRYRKALLKELTATVKDLNQRLKPLDRHAPRTPKTKSEAFMSAARLVLSDDEFKEVSKAAKLLSTGEWPQ